MHRAFLGTTAVPGRGLESSMCDTAKTHIGQHVGELPDYLLGNRQPSFLDAADGLGSQLAQRLHLRLIEAARVRPCDTE